MSTEGKAGFKNLLDAIDRYVEVKRAGVLASSHESARAQLMLALDKYIDERVEMTLRKKESGEGAGSVADKPAT